MVSRFNTQPPEGGWAYLLYLKAVDRQFQHTAARRRLGINTYNRFAVILFQHTAARRRLDTRIVDELLKGVFQHTAARRRLGFNSYATDLQVSFNTQPPEGGWLLFPLRRRVVLQVFQHTAARRRLDFFLGVFQ